MGQYLFLDEAGNFDFKQSGTDYLIVCAVLLQLDKGRTGNLAQLRYTLNDLGHDIDGFHASANTPYVRHQFVSVLSGYNFQTHIFAVVLNKRNNTKFYSDPAVAYLDMFKLVLQRASMVCPECPVYADRVPVQRSRKLIMKAVRESLGRRRVHFHPSLSSLELQIADYCTWAVWRRISRQDDGPWMEMGEPKLDLVYLA
jgi:hypothetical protein